MPIIFACFLRTLHKQEIAILRCSVLRLSAELRQNSSLCGTLAVVQILKYQNN